MYLKQARNFIYKNARPLDIARWKYLFEDGSPEDVLTALSCYQNPDGGFAHALEPDCWNPNSSPIQTWAATEIIREAGLEDKNHPLIQGILKYLASGKDFNGHVWFQTIKSNNDYPHAEWWDYDPIEDPALWSAPGYNPTACLTGFLLKFADRDSELFKLACRLAKEAYLYFKSEFPIQSMHTVSCFTSLYDYLKECSITSLLDMDEFRSLLQEQIKQIITYDTSKWDTDYICKPSLFIHSKESDFYPDNRQICDYECQYILNSQNPDGTWNITWAWADYPEQWHISKNWWKSDWIIKYLRYIDGIRS